MMKAVPMERALPVCERKMERTRGDSISLQWMLWMGEWSNAYHEVEDIADEMTAAHSRETMILRSPKDAGSVK